MAGMPTRVLNLPNAATDNSETPATAFAGTGLGAGLNQIIDDAKGTGLKVGSGTSSPSAGKVLRATGVADADGNQQSAWGQVQTPDVVANAIAKRQLSYNQTSAIWNGATIGIATTDFIANQSFTLDAANSLVVFVLRGAMLISNATVGAAYSMQLLVDSAGTPITISLCSDIQQVTNVIINPFRPAIAGVTTLAAGTHTVKPQLITNVAANTAYLRASGTSATEFLNLEVWEYKR